MQEINFDEMTKEELIKYIKDLDEIRSGKLGLVWDKEKEPEQIVLECNKKIPVLQEMLEKNILCNHRAIAQNNLLIEGDNFHSLSVLSYTHQEKIDVIYIDPPYNTENDNFIYNDKYVNKEDGFKHSKWLNFMEKRLQIAKSLLKEDGCIMISINENELFVLKLLCDKIFGEDNYLTMFSIKVRHEDRILKGDKDFHEVTEFLLFYQKTSKFVVSKREEENASYDKYKYIIEELINNPETEYIGNKKMQKFKPGEYLIKKVDPSKTALSVTNIRGSIKEGNSSGRFFMSYLNSRFEKEAGFLYKVSDIGADGLGYRYFRIPDKKQNRKNGDYYQGIPVNNANIQKFPFPNYLDFEVDFNNVAKEGAVEFRNGKKPIEFLKFLFTIAGLKKKKDAIVLDFFAGSGSTGHALLDFNREFGGNRKFILCTNNEISEKLEKEFIKKNSLTKVEFKKIKQNNDTIWMEYLNQNGICSTVTYPRMKNIIQGYDNFEPLIGNLIYYKTNFVDITGSKDQLYYDLTDKCIPMLCVKEDTHILVEENEEYKIYTDNRYTKYTCVYFDAFGLNYDIFIQKLKTIKDYKALYIFTLGNEINENELIDVDNYSIEPIPYKILELYKRIVALSKGY